MTDEELKALVRRLDDEMLAAPDDLAIDVMIDAKAAIEELRREMEDTQRMQLTFTSAMDTLERAQLRYEREHARVEATEAENKQLREAIQAAIDDDSYNSGGEVVVS